MFGVAGQEAEDEGGALRNDEAGLAFQGLVLTMDIGRIAQLTLVGEQGRVGTHRDVEVAAGVFASNDVERQVAV